MINTLFNKARSLTGLSQGKSPRGGQPRETDHHPAKQTQEQGKKPPSNPTPETMDHSHLPLPSQQFREKRDQGLLKADRDQEAVLPLLDRFVEDLHLTVKRTSWRGVDIWRGANGTPFTKGLYLFGPVGRGKSLLMQLVFDAVAFPEKRRVHFHPFMEELHQRMHDTTPKPGCDMMFQVASELSGEARLLCFDEFFIDNIQDAMLLGRLLDYLFQCGVTLCATSNCGPEGLFKGGFNRKRFLPLLDNLQANIDEINLSDGTDWRRDEGPETILHKQTPQQMFCQLTHSTPHPTTTVLDRMIIPALGVDQGIYWFDFLSLCDQQLGPAEYMDLSQKARAVLISDLPALGEDGTDAAIRLIILIDLLYEYQVPLRLFSHVPLESVCKTGPAAFPFKRAISRIFGLMKLEITTV
ncbi:MAG: cell division protein ZapE [Magnetococcales bacterium]|nr:cell division protein ZapE [Magnetococcales bacterium]